MDMGKGSKRRPEDKKKFDVNWDVIFGQAYPKVTRKKKKNELCTGPEAVMIFNTMCKPYR